MTRLTWNQTRDYELGLDRGVFYPNNGPGEVWNGLSSIIESTSDDTDKTRYIDGIKTHYRRGSDSFSGSIESISYPESLYEDVLTQKLHQNFGFCYRAKSAFGYRIHLVYNVSIKPPEKSHRQLDFDLLSWVFTTKPIKIPGAKASAHLIIDTTRAYASTLADLEDILYGTDVDSARLPSPDEILEIFEVNSILRVIDHGDGTFTVTGPNEAIQMIDPTMFQITWPSAVYIDEVSYRISSL